MPTSPSTAPPAASPGGGRRPGPRRLLVVAAVVIALLVAAVTWYLSQDAPDAVDIEAATSAVADAADGSPDAGGDDTGDAAADVAEEEADAEGDASASSTDAGDLSGDWAVDTTVGEFSVEDTTGTFVGFRVAEELTTLGAVDAVSRTPAVSGTVTVEGTTLAAAEITADLIAIQSDQPRREGAIQRALGTDVNPTAVFTATEAVELGDGLAAGEVVSVEVPGTLTINGTTQDVVVPLQVALTGDTVVVTGSLDVTFADYGVTAPTAPIVVSVEDRGQVELQLYLTRA